MVHVHDFLSPGLGEGIANTQAGGKSYPITNHKRFFLSRFNPCIKGFLNGYATLIEICKNPL